MKKYSVACLIGIVALGCAHAGVVGIDFSTNPNEGPGPDMLPGVVGKTTTNVTWNTIDSSDLNLGLVDENGLGTGVSFQFGTNSTVSFASKVNDASKPTGFFRTYAHLATGGNTDAFTNDFTIAGIDSATADLAFYATWGWVEAGSEFRVSGDGGTSWSDWTLCDGVPNGGEAAFSDGHSYVMFTNVAVHTDGTIIGEWMTTTNGASEAHRGPFNAIQVEASDFSDAQAPAFTTNVFSMPSVIEGEAYSADLSDELVSQGSQYVFSNLTAGTWLTIAPDGTMSGTPVHADAGANVFSVQVKDDLGQTDVATVTINVEPIYDRYIDSYDGDGIGFNTQEGGGLEHIALTDFTIDVTDDSDNLEFISGKGSNAGAQHGGVYTSQKYPVPEGFTLDVTYTIVGVPGTLSESVGIGIIDGVADLPGMLYYPTMHEAIGISLTARNSVQGLNHCTYTAGDADGTLTSLSTAQTISAGADRTFSLTVEADGSFSYSVDGAAPTTGVTSFDLTKEYHFAIYSQRATTGLEIQSVSFIPTKTVNSVDNISLEITGGAANFSWYGEAGGFYELQSRENLTTGGEEAWETVTNVAGADMEITISGDTVAPKEFYRVKLTD